MATERKLVKECERCGSRIITTINSVVFPEELRGADDKTIELMRPKAEVCAMCGWGLFTLVWKGDNDAAL